LPRPDGVTTAIGDRIGDDEAPGRRFTRARARMTYGMYWLGAAVGIGLLVYLVTALVRAEEF